MYDFDEQIEGTNIPEEFQTIGESINNFVRVNYATATIPTSEDITYYKGRISDIIRNNPPLKSIPKYLRDGREDYLWYRDFYDDISKDDYRSYQAFTIPVNEITPANYAGELAKIDLPYFKELIDLISLERLCMDYEEKIAKAKPEIKPSNKDLPEEESVPQEIEVEIATKPKQARRQEKPKRSYEPKLNNKQYSLLVECIERIRLFRSPLKVTELKRRLKGKLTEPLQVANQKSLVYFFDQLSENKYIKETWMSVTDGNEDFISFRTKGNEERYGSEPHYITMQQLLNCRNRNKRESIFGLVQIEETIEELEEYQDK